MARKQVIPISGDHGHLQPATAPVVLTATGPEGSTPRTPPGLGTDPRARVIGALALIIGVVLSPAPGPLEFAVLLGLVAAVAVLLEASPPRVLARACIVLPFAGAIAAFAPLARLEVWSLTGIADAYAAGWPVIFTILTKSYLSALVVTALTATTPIADLMAALHALRVPDIFLTMLTFLLRYADLFREQVRAMREAIASRAPAVAGWRLAVIYGSLGGNMFIRAYERGEQVYDAMRSRGYTGVLSGARPLTWSGGDTLFVVVAAVSALATALYR